MNKVYKVYTIDYFFTLKTIDYAVLPGMHVMEHRSRSKLIVQYLTVSLQSQKQIELY